MIIHNYDNKLHFYFNTMDLKLHARSNLWKRIFRICELHAEYPEKLKV